MSSVNVWMVEQVSRDNERVLTACRTRQQARELVKRQSRSKNVVEVRALHDRVTLDLANIQGSL